MNSKVKQLFLFLMCFGLALASCKETAFQVSGRILRQGTGYKGILVIADPISKEKSGSQIQYQDRTCETDDDGKFQFILSPGEYKIRTDFVYDDELKYCFVVGPENFTVKDKNIDNVNMSIFTEMEVLQANLDILNDIPDSTPAIAYEWGRVPLHSADTCRQYAQKELKSVVELIDSDLLEGATLGSPVVFYDFKDNPVFYQYPVVYSGVEIGYFGVHAVGLEPKIDRFAGYHEFRSKRELFPFQDTDTRMTWDTYLADARKSVAEKKHWNINDIQLVKFICHDALNNVALYVMLKKVPENEILLVNLFSYNILTDICSMEDIKKDSELQNCLLYIIQIKSQKKLPLMKLKTGAKS